MAEPNRPVGEASDDPRRPVADTTVDQPTTSAPSQPAAEEDVAFLEPPTDTQEEATPTRVIEPADTTAVQPAPPATPAQHEPAPATAVQPAPPAPTEQQPVLAPAAEAAPTPPKRASNRVVATAWVLLGAGLFQVLFFGINALVALVFGGAQAVGGQVQAIAGTALAWLPVLLFFLFFELVVLLIPRAGRVAYVLASLIVAVVVYVLTVLLFSLIARNGLGDANTLAQTFLNWEFILVGLVAREVMLWTGLAIGARGIRVRRRNKEARRRYDEELADSRA
jgi:hypothetical protein